MDLTKSILKQINMLYDKKYDADVFSFDMLRGPNVYQVLPYNVVEYIHQYVIDPRNSGNTKKKIEHLDEVLSLYGFKRFAAGTNRAVYGYLEDQSFCLKVSLDKTGMTNNPDEFKNQEYLKPFVCKIFSVSECGTIATVERVLPIRSRKEFAINAGSIFDVIANKFVGKYILEDIGTIWFKNWGIRRGFGPVLLDYPYLYEVDLNGLFCNEMTQLGLPCGGQIDYDDGFNVLYCTRCGKRHKAKQIGKAIMDNIIAYKGGNSMEFKLIVMRGDEVIVDKTKSDTHIDPDKVNKSNYVTEKVITGREKWNESDFDVIMVINGVKIGKKDGKTTILGNSKAKDTTLGSKDENPFNKIRTNVKTPKEPKNGTKIVVPDWAKEQQEQINEALISNRPNESVEILLDMSDFGKKPVKHVTDKKDFSLKVILPGSDNESEETTTNKEEDSIVTKINNITPTEEVPTETIIEEEDSENTITEEISNDIISEAVFNQDVKEFTGSNTTNEILDDAVATEEAIFNKTIEEETKSETVEYMDLEHNSTITESDDGIQCMTEEECRKFVDDLNKSREEAYLKERSKIGEAYDFAESDFERSADANEETDLSDY